MAGVFAWRYLGASGRELGSSPPFPDRDAAEAWMGSSWDDLRARGIQAVELIEDGRDEPVYRMSLADDG